MTHRRILAAIVLASAMLAASPAVAGFDEGTAALRVGQYAVAFDIWQKSAEAGDAKSQYGLGYLYQFGLGVDADNTQALNWYRRAADQNVPDALFALGLMYESGRAGERDRAKAIELYKRAAATGQSPDAEFALGRVYWRGLGVPQDQNQGLDWLVQAARVGQPGAQYILGEAYEVGGLIPQDKILAYYWYSAALDGDEVTLRLSDPEFDPKTALDVLKAHMSKSEIKDAEAKLKKEPPPQAPPPPAPAGTKG